MAVEKVRHVGDLVACVAAVDEATAMEALNLFEIEWEVLDPVFDPRKGLEDQDEPIHWRGKYHVGTTNVQKRVFQEFGDRSLVDDPTASSHGKWRMEVHHGFTEPHAVVSIGILDVSNSTLLSKCHYYRHFQPFSDPMHQINVIRTFVGGGLVANRTHSRTCAQPFFL